MILIRYKGRVGTFIRRDGDGYALIRFGEMRDEYYRLPIEELEFNML